MGILIGAFILIVLTALLFMAVRLYWWSLMAFTQAVRNTQAQRPGPRRAHERAVAAVKAAERA